MRIIIFSREKRALLFRCMGYLIPFITLPFFVRLIPTTDYGRLGIVLTICGVLSAICEGGANIGGAKQLTLAKTQAERNMVSDGIYRHKWFLLLVCLVGGAVYCIILTKSKLDLFLFVTCFCFIVVPDALTPTWVFYSKGAVDELTSRLLLSRLLTLGPAMFLVWLVPNSLAGAIATGLPFVVFAIVARSRARELIPVVSIKSLKVAQSSRKTAQPLLHLGSLAALTFPAIVIQMLAWSGRDNMGAAYLIVSVWVALRQLCIIPNQSVFHLAVSMGEQQKKLQQKLRNAMLFGGILALMATIFVLIVGESLLRLAFGPQYAQLNSVLVPLFASVAVFVIGHGVAMNRLVAHGRNWNFFLSYILSLSTFIGIFFTLASYGHDQRLIWSIVAADSTLMIVAIAFDTWGRRVLRVSSAS